MMNDRLLNAKPSRAAFINIYLYAYCILFVINNHYECIYDVALELSKTLMILRDLEDLIRPISTEAAEIIRRKSAGLERRYKEIANGTNVDDQAG